MAFLFVKRLPHDPMNPQGVRSISMLLFVELFGYGNAWKGQRYIESVDSLEDDLYHSQPGVHLLNSSWCRSIKPHIVRLMAKESYDAIFDRDVTLRTPYLLHPSWQTERRTFFITDEGLYKTQCKIRVNLGSTNFDRIFFDIWNFILIFYFFWW